MSERAFLSCIDVGRNEPLTQPIQHLVIANYAKSVGGAIVFYTGEDPLTLGSLSVLRAALQKRPKIDGVVFFRLRQFCYRGRLDFSALTDILDQGYEIHFAREAQSIRDRQGLSEQFETLLAYDILQNAESLNLVEAADGAH